MVNEKKIKLSPLHSVHKARGANMVSFAGWKLPLYYSGIIQEHNHVRNHVGLFDVSHMGRIEIDLNSSNLLEKHIPLDIYAMKIGQVKYTFLINKKGKIIDDLLVYRFKEKILLVVNASRFEIVVINLSKISGLFFKELSATAQISIQGPKSNHLIQKFFNKPFKLSFMQSEEFNFNSSQYIISRTGYTGEDGYELIGGKNIILSMVPKLLRYPELSLIGLGARDSLRIEAGLCLYGHEIKENINPFEVNISWTINKKRMEMESFCGASTYKKILKHGPKLKIYGFIVLDKYIARTGAEISNLSGTNKGYVSSGCFSPTLDKSICMSFIDSNWDESEELFVKIRNKFIKIRKVNLPFVKHKYIKQRKI